MKDHLLRIGLLGEIGRFRTTDGSRYQRGTQVVCRSDRGLEFGVTLAAVDKTAVPPAGVLLRKASVEDQLLWARIQKHRDAAFRECQQLLAKEPTTTTLMDVELLFDGQTIFFYFLGVISPQIEALTTQLAEAYEAKVQLRQFADAMAAGCGPDCGTEDGLGCGDGGCSSCAVAGACGSNVKSSKVRAE